MSSLEFSLSMCLSLDHSHLCQLCFWGFKFADSGHTVHGRHLASPAREPKGPLALVVWYYIAKADMMFISRVLYAGLQGLLYSNLLLDS